MKAAIIILSDPKNGGEDALGRMFNGLAAAYDFKQRDIPVSIYFQGAGTRWPGVVGQPSPPGARALQGRGNRNRRRVLRLCRRVRCA